MKVFCVFIIIYSLGIYAQKNQNENPEVQQNADPPSEALGKNDEIAVEFLSFVERWAKNYKDDYLNGNRREEINNELEDLDRANQRSADNEAEIFGSEKNGQDRESADDKNALVNLEANSKTTQQPEILERGDKKEAQQEEILPSNVHAEVVSTIEEHKTSTITTTIVPVKFNEESSQRENSESQPAIIEDANIEKNTQTSKNAKLVQSEEERKSNVEKPETEETHQEDSSVRETARGVPLFEDYTPEKIGEKIASGLKSFKNYIMNIFSNKE